MQIVRGPIESIRIVLRYSPRCIRAAKSGGPAGACELFVALFV